MTTLEQVKRQKAIEMGLRMAINKVSDGESVGIVPNNKFDYSVHAMAVDDRMVKFEFMHPSDMHVTSVAVSRNDLVDYPDLYGHIAEFFDHFIKNDEEETE